MIKNILYSPIPDDRFKLQHPHIALFLSWVLILGILGFALWSTSNLADIVTINDELATSGKIQTLSPSQDLRLSSLLPINILSQLTMAQIHVKFVDNSIPLGICPISHPILWDLNSTMNIQTDNSIFLRMDANSTCSCDSGDTYCSVRFVFHHTSALNWRVLAINYAKFYFNFAWTQLTTQDNLNTLKLSDLGLVLIIEDYSVNGITLDISSNIIEHSIILTFNDFFVNLVNYQEGSLIGNVPTIIITKPSFINYITTFLAVSFGLFGFIGVLLRIFFYKEVTTTQSSIKLTSYNL